MSIEDLQISEIAEIEKINIQVLKLGTMEFHILGQSTMIMNRMSEKARQMILLPRVKKLTQAEKAAVPKHNPLQEFRASAYRNRDPKEHTLFHLPTNCFKKAIAQAAVDVEGSTRAEIGRLTAMVTTQINLYGVPQLAMAVTRSADRARTPDVRTRAYFPQWACSFKIRFVKNLLNERVLYQLLQAAGLIVGVGDWRPEKGSGSFGQFGIVAHDDKEYLEVRKQARKAQQEAYDDPAFFDADTEDLYAWFQEESIRREQESTEEVERRAARKSKKGNSGEAEARL